MRKVIIARLLRKPSLVNLRGLALGAEGHVGIGASYLEK